LDIKVLVPIAQGTEEMEAVTIIDILRRAKISVKLAGENEIITCSRGLKVIPDILLDSIEDDDEFDAIIIPGGIEGVNNLRNHDIFNDVLLRHNKKEKFIGAICAAPIILYSAKIISKDTKITCNPLVANQLEGFDILESPVVLHENIITSQGAGTAIEFSLKIVELLVNKETAQNIAKSICFFNYE
jgi:4-methyl-5(b-hydroxyethyl)-thiazole monophosphate biosynthesis